MKRIMALLLALVMAAGVLVGCGGSGGGSDEGDNVLTVGIPQSSVISSYTKDNGFTNYLQEKLGIEIKFYYFSNTVSEYRQQLALMCSANQALPDVLVGMDLEHYTMNQYGEDGYFLDLTDLIEQYAENYKKALADLKETDPEVAEYASEKVKNTNNGAIYGMPRILPIATDSVQSLMHINKNWLDQLGLEVPTTLAELENVLQQFATHDLNGNGQNDEIAMIGGAGVRDYIINAFVYFQDTVFNVTDGKVWDPVYTDEFRQALIFGNNLVKKGLYDSKSFSVTNTSELRNLISPADAPSKVGVFTGLSTVMTNVNSPAIGEFTILPALEDATGKGGYMVIEERQVAWTGFITKDCKNPELAMKFLDLFYDDETVSRQRHGIEGVDWVRYEGTNGSGTASYVKQINSEAFFEGKSTWGTTVLGICTDYNYLTVSEDASTDRIAQTQRLVKETWDLMHTAKEAEERAVHLVYTPDEYVIREAKQNIATSYLLEQVTLFFAGEKNPADDAQWNEFLDTLTGLGRQELLQIAQAAYDRK